MKNHNSQLLREIDLLQKRINKFRPFSAQNIAQLKAYYKVGLTFSSNALEGNSLSESETKVILEDGITIGGKPLKDHFEVVGHGDAFEKMFAIYQDQKITEKIIKELHTLFYHRIDADSAGEYRKIQVLITGSKYPLPKPNAIPKLMRAMVKNIALQKSNLHKVEWAAKLHKEFVFIHPFVDGNGRVGRLLMNLALLQTGHLPAIIPPILRAEYIRALELAHENDEHFIQFICEMVRETQKDYLRLVE